MKATELRIGNLIGMDISRDPQNIFYVDEVAEDAMKTYDCGLSCAKNGEVGYHDCCHFEGIPLTKEWFLKFDGNIVNHIHGYSFYTLSKSKKNHCHLDFYEHKTEWMGHVVTHCKYVHQIQNLYFVLTGKELEIVKTSA